MQRAFFAVKSAVCIIEFIGKKWNYYGKVYFDVCRFL